MADVPHGCAIQSSIEAHKRACESSIEFFLEQQKKELAGEGADVNVITMLENKHEELLKTLEDIKSWSELLSEWQIWKKQVLPEISVLQAKKEQRQTDFDQDTIRLQEATDAWIRKRDQVVASIKECRSAIVSIEGQLLVVANCLEDRLKSYESTRRHEAYDTAWEANSLRGAMITFQQQITESEGQLRKLTLKMRTAFLEVPHAAPSTYFQDRLYNRCLTECVAARIANWSISNYTNSTLSPGFRPSVALTFGGIVIWSFELTVGIVMGDT